MFKLTGYREGYVACSKPSVNLGVFPVIYASVFVNTRRIQIGFHNAAHPSSTGGENGPSMRSLTRQMICFYKPKKVPVFDRTISRSNFDTPSLL